MESSLLPARPFTERIVDLSPLANLYSQEVIEEIMSTMQDGLASYGCAALT
jgi:hypothetical protein